MEKQMKNGIAKSRWFSRLMVLAMGLVLSVGGILGAVLFVSDGSQQSDYADAATFREARDLRVGDYIQNFGGRKWRVIGHDTNGSITGMAGAPLLRADSAEPGERRFHSSPNNMWVGSELRDYLNGAFFTNNFSAAERAMVIENVRLETIRTNTPGRFYPHSINGSGYAEFGVGVQIGGQLAGISIANHNTRHRYWHRDTVFILCAWQNYNLDRLGLRYGNAAQTVDAELWQTNNVSAAGDSFVFPRRRDASGDANRQSVSAWTRSPWVASPWEQLLHTSSVAMLCPRTTQINYGSASWSTYSGWCSCCGTNNGWNSGPRSFTPALYLAPSTIFAFARNSEVGRNEQSGFRVYQVPLAAPDNVRVYGNTLQWNAVANATGYQIRLGNNVVHTVGAVTSINLLNIPVGNLPIGTHNNVNVVAIRSSSPNSAPSANVSWARLVAPTELTINGAMLSWRHSGAGITHFEVRLGESTVASVPVGTSDLHTLYLNRVPGCSATGTIVGAYRALALGAHSLSVVAVNTLGISPASNVVVYDRQPRVNSISISGTQSLTVSWPRPDSVNGMPTGQLSAALEQVYGTNSGVTWSSVNPDIVSVDPLSGAIHAAWPEGMSMWELSQRVNQFTLIQAVSSVSGVVAEFRVDVFFQTPPVPVVAGVIVSGARAFEIAPCGTTLVGGASLTDAAQFVATAFGYNLTGANVPTFTWASSEPSVATIDAGGMLTIRAAGITRITATSSIGGVPYAFDVAVSRDNTALATRVAIYCELGRTDERRLVVPYDNSANPYVDLRSVIDGYNIINQLVTWTSSCGATLASPSQFLKFSNTENGIRVTGLVGGGPFVITATPVSAIGVVGNFIIFVDQAVAPVVTSVSVSAPSNTNIILPQSRPLLYNPFIMLSASTVGVAGGSGSAVVWTAYPAGFVTLVVSETNPNIVYVAAIDRGVAAFVQNVVITATSVISSGVSASRTLTVIQGQIMGIEISAGGAESGSLFMPYVASEVAQRQGLDLRAVVAVTHSSVSQSVVWVSYPLGLVQFDNARQITAQGSLDSLVTVRPLGVGVVTITAVSAYCGTVSNVFEIEIVQASPTSVRIGGPNENSLVYEMTINLPRPSEIHLPTVRLAAWVGGSHGAASGLVWTSSCGGAIVEILGRNVGNNMYVRGLDAGAVTITATHPQTEFYATFTIIVDKARLYSAEILADGVVREQTAMLIPLVYRDGVYTLSELAERQVLSLSVTLQTHGNVATDFVWTSSDESVVRISGALANSLSIDRNGNVAVLPYGVGVATIRAVSVLDPSIYAEFTIFVTRGTASCVIQDGILDLPTIQEGYVRIILVCEHYFGAARMSHVDMSLEYAQNFELPTLEINITGAIFFGWVLSRNGELLETLPVYLLDIEYGLDTLLIFAVWYIPYIPSENGSSNLARNIIIGTLSVAGVGAAGTAGYIAQSKIRARRKENIDEWGMD
ncbi:MAG: Ig-like domain-containing protein [Firmicutes bacterium]|nr:Ig-like domain-containing protein [Bacillota bacterium]